MRTLTQLQTKDQRVEVRLATWQKTVLQEAALLEGVNLSDFILAKTMEAASNIIEQTQTLASQRLSSGLKLPKYYQIRQRRPRLRYWLCWSMDAILI